MASSLLNVTKKILRKAAELGVDEAGARLCGPSAWPVVKQLLSPVFQELERRYPKLLLVPEELEMAENDLSSDESLESLLHLQLSVMREGHQEILGVLFRYEETLQSYRELFYRAIEEADNKHESRHEVVIEEIGGVKKGLAVLAEKINEAAVPSTLSLDEIYRQANSYQMDAMKWISAGDATAASQRLGAARKHALGGLARDEGNARLMVTLGYIEKSQAQVSTLLKDPEGATENLALAAQYFANAMELDPASLDALNGMANVYYYGRDYDSAIQLGIAVVEADPNHAPALNDLSLALEEKLKEAGQEPGLIETLVAIYERLEHLMPRFPQLFPATYLAYVQHRLADLRSARAAP